jgi:hypothetical protein
MLSKPMAVGMLFSFRLKRSLAREDDIDWEQRIAGTGG